MGAKIVYLPGDRYGRLTVVDENGRTPHGQVMVDCLCDCGAPVNVRGYSLRQGRTQSCGCLQAGRVVEAVTTHGHTTGRTRGEQWSPTYLSWSAMIARCMNPRGSHYYLYGGRGITVCDRWLAFENFLIDMGKRPANRTLDRINNDGNYEPGNCRWATVLEQSRNKRPWGEAKRKEARKKMQESYEGMTT